MTTTQKISAMILAAMQANGGNLHAAIDSVFGGPKQERREPDADCFRIGDEWRSPSGAVHRVVRAGGRTVMLLNTGTGKTQKRPWDAIGAHSSRPWVRVFCGA